MKMHERLVRHAQKYGVDGVAEAAVDVGFELDELTELLVALDPIEQRSKPRITQRHKKVDVRVIAEHRAKKLLGINDDEET